MKLVTDHTEDLQNLENKILFVQSDFGKSYDKLPPLL